MSSWTKHKPWIITESEGRSVDLLVVGLVLFTFVYLIAQIGRGWLWWF